MLALADRALAFAAEGRLFNADATATLLVASVSACGGTPVTMRCASDPNGYCAPIAQLSQRLKDYAARANGQATGLRLQVLPPVDSAVCLGGATAPYYYTLASWAGSVGCWLRNALGTSRCSAQGPMGGCGAGPGAWPKPPTLAALHTAGGRPNPSPNPNPNPNAGGRLRRHKRFHQDGHRPDDGPLDALDAARPRRARLHAAQRATAPLCPLPSALCPLPSALSALCPLCPLPSALCPLCPLCPLCLLGYEHACPRLSPFVSRCDCCWCRCCASCARSQRRCSPCTPSRAL